MNSVAGLLVVVNGLQKTRSISHIYIHLLTNFTGFETSTYFENISKHFPSISFIASGDTIKDLDLSLPNLKILRSSAEIKNYFKSI